MTPIYLVDLARQRAAYQAARRRRRIRILEATATIAIVALLAYVGRGAL